ncbi:MAG TPA: DUF1501 domain-containing protein [Saprospiraceae bacterium]|nr:DUF1501 domain-containing protein [Saprospiraceae bacterium]
MKSKEIKNYPQFDQSLEDQHNQEHIHWNRRQFLGTGGMLSLGSVMLGGLPASPLLSPELLASFAGSNQNRILVLIKMFGGNDGLNMVIPHSEAVGNEFYRKTLRPNISLKHGTHYDDSMLLSGFGTPDWALPSQLSGFMPLWKEGKMNIIQNVGYPNQDYSHFTSDRYWSTASDSIDDKTNNSGWMGRFLEKDYPAMEDTPTSVPPAMRIGYYNDYLFLSPQARQTELVFYDANQFYQFAQRGALHSTDGLGNCEIGDEKNFLRQLTNNSLRYSEKIYQAYNKSKQYSTPPANQGYNNIANDLGIVSRLIRGGLGTRVYLVAMGGFDTHESQMNIHPRLMLELNNAVTWFLDDLKKDNAQTDVAVMTYSEFGRTIRENGSQGTDHGNLSTMFMFGEKLSGGFHGNPMVLDDAGLSTGGTLLFFEDAKQKATDFRSVFGSTLQQWMCVDDELVDFSMGSNYKRLALFDVEACSGIQNKGSNNNAVLLGHNPDLYNPSQIVIKFSQLVGSETELYIKSINGKTIAKLHDKYTPAGSYNIIFDPLQWKVPRGEYIYQLNSGGKIYARKFNIF